MLTMQTAKDPTYKADRETSLLNSLRQRRLLTLIVEVAASCNLECTFCSAHSGRAPKFKENAGLMRPDTWAIVLESITQYVAERGPLEMMQLYGNGEPLLNKKLPSIIRSIADGSLARKIRVITNGVLLTPEKLNELADAGVDEIHISLDTVDPARYEAVKKRDEAERVVRNIQACIPVIEARRDVSLFIKYFSHIEGNIHGMILEDSIAVRDLFIDAARTSDFVHLKEMPLIEVKMKDNSQETLSPCELPFYMLYIMHTGKVSVCCADVFNAITVGHIAKTIPPVPGGKPTAEPVSSLTDILESEPLYEVRKKHIERRSNEIRLCAGCGNRTQVDLSMLDPEQVADIKEWIRPLQR